jgi:hypothetical protein
MLDIKVQCDCGQRYQFEVEPVDGRMPASISCPACGLEGTDKANQLIQEKLAQALAGQTPPRPRIRLATAAAPPPEEAAAASPSSPPPPPPSLRPQVARPAAGGVPRRGVAPAAAPAVPGRKPSFAMGLVGALAGALIGSAVYFVVLNFAGYGFLLKPLALGVGALAGLGSRWLSRGEGSNELGVITAVFVLAGILGSQYVVARIWWNSVQSESLELSYESELAEARKVVASIPNGTDEEIRLYLAVRFSEEDEDAKINLNDIPKEIVQEFRDTELPDYRELASGKLTKELFNEKHQKEIAQDKADKESDEGTFKAFFLLMFIFDKFTIVCLCLAAGTAYKITANAQ